MSLPKFEDWTPPWGSDSDNIDADKAAKFIYGLLSDKEKLQDKVSTATQERDTARTEVTEKQKELDAAVAATSTDAEAVTKAQEEARKANERAAEAELISLKLQVAADNGLPLAQAKRLQGKTKEELEADATEFAKSFGSSGQPGDDDDEHEEDEGYPARTPQRITNPGDGGRGSDKDRVIDIDKAIADIPRIG